MFNHDHLFRLVFFTVLAILLNFVIRGSEEDPLGNLDKDLSGWSRGVLHSIQEEEYFVSWQEKCTIPDGEPGYHMVNRAQDLRLYFYPESVKVIRRTDSFPSWVHGWNLAGVGKAHPVPGMPPGFKIDKNKIEYTRGAIIESYENCKTGIRQKIIVNKPYEGLGPLKIVFEYSGDLNPVRKNDRLIEFHDKSKAILQMHRLRVEDSEEEELVFRSSLEKSRLIISIHDENAAYPLTLDAIIVSLPPWISSGKMAKENFGYSVSSAGDVNGDGFSDLIIGAPSYDNGEGGEGKVYLFTGGPDGPENTSLWQYEGNDVNARVGESVATAGDVDGDGFSDVIIGAPGMDRGETDEGCALIIFGSDTSLDSRVDFLESNQADSKFGSCVSTAGDINGDGYSDVIVGAKNFTNSLTEEGAAFVYTGSDTGINTAFTWSQYGGQEYAHFGQSVCMAGDVNRDGFTDVIVGAPYMNAGIQDEGTAYVYHGSSTGLSNSPDWSKAGGSKSDFLGISVCTAGDVNGDSFADVIVGMSGYDNGQVSEGAANIYLGSATGLASTPDITLEPDHEHSYFGSSVYTAGDVNGDGYSDVITGAYFSSNGESMEGAAYLYTGSKNGIKKTPKWSAEGNQEGANYGLSVCTAGDVNGDGYSDIIVGAPNFDAVSDNEGRCFVYYGGPDATAKSPSWITKGTQTDAEFGFCVAGACDVNGDGCDDIMISAPFFDNGQSVEGQVRIYHGAPNEGTPVQDKILEINHAGAFFGFSAAPAGDINNDGYGDIVIGAPGYDNKGMVMVYYGSNLGVDTSGTWSFYHGGENARYGESVAGAGDVNGDGFSDIIVGAPQYPNASARGSVFVYHGSEAGLPVTSQQWYFESQEDDSFLGKCVAGAGDVNGDGYSDIVIGSPGYTNEQDYEGAAYLFYGSHYGITSNDFWVGEINQAYASFGKSVSSAGDVNGDGYSDVIIGAPDYDDGEGNEGGAFVYHGGPNGITGMTPSWQNSSNQEYGSYGSSVATAGDVNGDGFSDIIIGAYSYDLFSVLDGGAAYIHLGSKDGLSEYSDWGVVSSIQNSWLGYSVASCGDVNGDGFSDVIIGSPGYRESANKIGRVHLYLGGGGNGRYRDPRQYNQTPRWNIGRLGHSSIDLAGISITIFSPWGRGKVKTEWEYKSFGTMLDGTDTKLIPAGWRETKLIVDRAGIQVYDQPQNRLIHWRARIIYHPAMLPWQPHGPWVSIPWNGMQEADFRMGPSEQASLQDIIDRILGRNHYPYDMNSDTIIDSADAIYLIIK